MLEYLTLGEFAVAAAHEPRRAVRLRVGRRPAAPSGGVEAIKHQVLRAEGVADEG